MPPAQSPTQTPKPKPLRESQPVPDRGACNPRTSSQPRRTRPTKPPTRPPILTPTIPPTHPPTGPPVPPTNAPVIKDPETPPPRIWPGPSNPAWLPFWQSTTIPPTRPPTRPPTGPPVPPTNAPVIKDPETPPPRIWPGPSNPAWFPYWQSTNAPFSPTEAPTFEKA